MSKKVQKKYKRHPVNWYYIVTRIYDNVYEARFWLYRQNHSSLSINRVAFNYFKKTHSTTAIDKIRDLLSKGFDEDWICEMLNQGY